MTLGEKIGKLRKDRYWSQTWLADLVGARQPVISNWEQDYVQPNIYNLQRIARAFNITIDELLKGVEL